MRASAIAALAVLVIAAPLPAVAHAQAQPQGQAQAPDPVGDYVWAFAMASGDSVHGTMHLARTDSGYAATFTSDHTDGALATHNVKVDGRHVVVDLTGDFGDFTLDMQLADSIAATYKLVMSDGEPSNGPIVVRRGKQSSSAEPQRRRHEADV